MRPMEAALFFCADDGHKKLVVAGQNIMTPKGIELRINRFIQVEGEFGVLKQDYPFR